MLFQYFTFLDITCWNCDGNWLHHCHLFKTHLDHSFSHQCCLRNHPPRRTSKTLGCTCQIWYKMLQYAPGTNNMLQNVLEMLQYAPATNNMLQNVLQNVIICTRHQRYVTKCVTKCYNMHLLLKLCYQQIKVCLHKFIKTHDLYPARLCDVQYRWWLKWNDKDTCQCRTGTVKYCTPHRLQKGLVFNLLLQN